MDNLKYNNLAVCNTCTRFLVETAYKKSFCFRFFREPLKFAMRFWVKIKRIDLSNYEIKTPYCKNCNRFYKNALKNNSTFFVWLNNKINPLFDKWLENIVGNSEIQKSKQNALEFTKNENLSNETINFAKWTKI